MLKILKLVVYLKNIKNNPSPNIKNGFDLGFGLGITLDSKHYLHFDFFDFLCSKI